MCDVVAMLKNEERANFVYTAEKAENVLFMAHRTSPEWILDSGASKHVTGNSKEFELYNSYPPTHKETVQIADGTRQPIVGVGSVQCTPTIKLYSALHVPAFPVNLVSLSALVDQQDCRIILDREGCLIQDRQTRRQIGTGTKDWYRN